MWNIYYIKTSVIKTYACKTKWFKHFIGSLFRTEASQFPKVSWKYGIPFTGINIFIFALAARSIIMNRQIMDKI